MKRLALYAALIAPAGCGGGDNITRQDMETVKAELKANDERMAASLRSELTGVDQKYVKVQQLEMEINKKLDDLGKLEKQIVETSRRLEGKIELATANVIKVLEFEEKLLTERLTTLRGLLEELKKK
jgi:predicted nuclease with TOPRIM domain